MALESLNDDVEAEYIESVKRYIVKESKGSEGTEMLNLLESGEWKLGTQEYYYIKSNPENVYSYLKYRFQFWKSLNRPDFENVSSFPLYLVVEPASICNLRCQMCWQQEPIMHTKPYIGKMNFSVFKKIVDEAQEKKCHAITLAGRGEPLINPEICDFLEYAANKLYELKINTNGILLNEKISHAILKANVSLVVFSAEGTTQEQYAKTRCGGDFHKLIGNIRLFNEIRSKYYPNNRTQTRVSGVIVDSTMDKEGYYDFWSTLVDEVALVKLEDRRDTYANAADLNNSPPCYRLWQQMYIWWDGSCSPCDNDYLVKLKTGDLSKQEIQDIWNGEAYNAIRELHRKGKRHICIPCDRCGL